MKTGSSETKALVKYRMKRARMVLRVAQKINQDDEDPASVVNRAYYAMDYAALALLATIGQQTTKHGGVLALFDMHFIKPKILPKEMSKFLHRALDMRHMGDYEEEAEITREQSSKVLDSAIQFINSIEQKLSEQI
jgi:uncharacterized protein (UPF0332 family)